MTINRFTAKLKNFSTFEDNYTIKGGKHEQNNSADDGGNWPGGWGENRKLYY